MKDNDLCIRLYEHSQANEWDDFVENSKNGTFLFKRRYMEYHRDRFIDNSLVFYCNKRVIALLPANRVGSRILSHQGLTYGGLILDEHMTTPIMINIFDKLMFYLKEELISEIIYKSIPYIYHRLPADEDKYCLYRLKATLHRRDVLSVILSSGPAPTQTRRRRSVAKARKAELNIECNCEDWDEFWSILVTNLSDRHGIAPVHSVDEMKALAHHFPKEIWLCSSIDKNGRMLAGVVVYETKRVMHVQYIASNSTGREIGALDLVLDILIDRALANHKHFDFGSSNEQNGLVLNTGLIEQKEGFGARSIAHDFYTLKVL